MLLRLPASRVIKTYKVFEDLIGLGLDRFGMTAYGASTIFLISMACPCGLMRCR
jgi:hypothetical protein